MNDARTRTATTPNISILSLLPIIALMIAVALSGCGGGEPTPLNRNHALSSGRRGRRWGDDG